MNVDFIRQDELEELMTRRDEICVSIYLPMARVGPDVSGNHIRLKNALQNVAEQLEERDWRPPRIEALLEEPRQLLHESPFWQHQADGLAVFIAPDFFEIYRVPIDFEPLTLISDRFHVKPLLPLFSDDGRFYILALSQSDVRLFQGTRHAVDEIQLEGVPRSIEDALWTDDAEEQIRSHTVTSGAGGEPAAEPGVTHHGQGIVDDEMLQRLRRYFDEVSEGIQQMLADTESPLVLAAVDYLHPIYKEVSDSPHLLDEGVIGNPDELSAQELHQQAWPIVKPIFEDAKEEAANRYRQLAHDEEASDQLEEIVLSAVQGRVDTLFVAVGTQKWGNYDVDTHSVALHEEPQNGDEDLLDFAAMQTMANGGTVYAVSADDVPSHTPIAAVFRF